MNTEQSIEVYVYQQVKTAPGRKLFIFNTESVELLKNVELNVLTKGENEKWYLAHGF